MSRRTASRGLGVQDEAKGSERRRGHGFRRGILAAADAGPAASAVQARLDAPAPGGARTLRLHVLASGSRGNAAVVEDASTGAGVLVDCGICKRDFLARCDEAGFDPARLAAILV